MDAPAADKTKLLNQLKKRFSDGCIDFTGAHDDNAALADVMEDIAMQSETAMESYLEEGTIPDETIRELIAERALFPCFFGSALKMEGIDEFIAGFDGMCASRSMAANSARVYIKYRTTRKAID